MEQMPLQMEADHIKEEETLNEQTEQKKNQRKTGGNILMVIGTALVKLERRWRKGHSCGKEQDIVQE